MPEKLFHNCIDEITGLRFYQRGSFSPYLESGEGVSPLHGQGAVAPERVLKLSFFIHLLMCSGRYLCVFYLYTDYISISIYIQP